MVRSPLGSEYDNDEMAADFDRHAVDSAYNAHYDRPAVLGLLGDVAGLDVLDAGCGPGIYLETLLDRGAKVVAFDASASMVALAKARADGRAEVHHLRLDEPLPFADGSFDLVVCALAIHYVDDRGAALAEMHRVLRPGGAAVVSTGHPTSDWLRKGGSYFDVAIETDIWQTPRGELEMRYWREPITTLCEAAYTAGFLIERLVEPQPADTMKDKYPEDYERLRTEPGFLILRLLKPA